MIRIKQGEIYTRQNGRLHSPEHRVSFVMPHNCSGYVNQQGDFIIKTDNEGVEGTMFFHGPTNSLTSGWDKKGFRHGGETLYPTRTETLTGIELITHFESSAYVCYKVSVDLSGYGLAFMVYSDRSHKKVLDDVKDSLIRSVSISESEPVVQPVEVAVEVPSHPVNQPDPIEYSPRYVQCGACAGSGYVTCMSCSGYGYFDRSYTRTAWDGSPEYVTEQVPCSSSVGGRQSCMRCGGSGQILE